jgi:predicted transcriptional regulator of viral defense system
MYFSKAIEAALHDSGMSVITEFSLFGVISPLLAMGTYADQPIARMPSLWGHDQLRAMIRTLTKRRILAPDDDFKNGAWRVVRALTTATPEEAICLVDPFAYVSHLSAMQRYGLTDRSPEALHITTPKRMLWSEIRAQRVRELLGEVPSSATPPPLVRIGLGPEQNVRGRPVILHQTVHPAVPTQLAGASDRIASIGRVFVDMLDQPQLCGGIHHVLDCFARHAETWQDEIVTAVDEYDSPIVKVRAGYIFDEELSLANPATERWTQFAQRGGSRKLDPHTPYGSVFSEKWMLALNV